MKHLVAAVVLVFSLPLPSLADDTEVAALLARPDDFDGSRVSVTGELVGDYSPRDEGVWVQLNDDPYVRRPIGQGGVPAGANTGIGALIPGAIFDATDLGPPGRYGRLGPEVALTGTFIHSDPDLGGETYILVEEMALIHAAEAYAVPGPDMWLVVGLALLAVAGTITFVARRLAGRRSPEADVS
jgi:hypothetical protein